MQPEQDAPRQQKFFRNRALWERFNLTAADGKNWLPDDITAREKEQKAHNRHADQYGLPLAS